METLSNWRADLREIRDTDFDIPSSQPETEKQSKVRITDKNVKNKVVINPPMREAFEEIGGELLEVFELTEKEVDVPDTRRTVDAIRAYDRAKDASRDATYDTDKGKKKKGDKEKAYAKKERGEIKKDDPNWKNRKYHTGMHGESVDPKKQQQIQRKQVMLDRQKLQLKQKALGQKKNMASNEVITTEQAEKKTP